MAPGPQAATYAPGLLVPPAVATDFASSCVNGQALGLTESAGGAEPPSLRSIARQRGQKARGGLPPEWAETRSGSVSAANKTRSGEAGRAIPCIRVRSKVMRSRCGL